MKRAFFTVSLVLLTGMLTVMVLPNATASLPPPYEDDMWSKLGRGTCNILTSPLEVIQQPVNMANAGERWPIAGAGGALKGVFFAVARGLVGVYEVLTFPMPNSCGNYEPIMEPEYILPKG